MPGTPREMGVCRDQMIEPVLISSTAGRGSHIRDLAPMDWSDQDRRKYHQVELQALLEGTKTSGHAAGDSCSWTKVF
jgi:hypothetical protein